MNIEKYGDDHICWDCGGVNWCFCWAGDTMSLFPMEGDPICECGRLGYECRCPEEEEA